MTSRLGMLALALALAGGCARVVRYPLGDVLRLGGPIARSRLSVQTLREERSNFACWKAWHAGAHVAVVSRGEGEWYCNSGQTYRDHAVARHALFAQVAVDDGGGSADYVLSGALERFEGLRERKAVAEAFAAQKGLTTNTPRPGGARPA